MAIEIAEIPSIKGLYLTAPARVWLVKHYPQISNALFDGCTHDAAVSLFAKLKYQKGNLYTRKRSVADLRVMREVKKKQKEHMQEAEYLKTLPDKWAKTAWNIVK